MSKHLSRAQSARVLKLFEAPIPSGVIAGEKNGQSNSMSSLPDAAERSRALDPSRSFLVQAPAGSGKTHLLTQRFLRLLGEAQQPEEIVAITFTNAAAAEMRNRILDQLERAEAATGPDLDPESDHEAFHDSEPESLASLAHRATLRSKLLGWKILDQPGVLRITTIDAFCRSIALQSPLSWGQLSGLGGRLEQASDPEELYCRAASAMMERLLSDETQARILSSRDRSARVAVEALLLWRDNNWKDVEELTVRMLAARNRWYQDFVFQSEPDWKQLRKRLEAPFCRAARRRLLDLVQLFGKPPGCLDAALELARLACLDPGEKSPLRLAERADLPIRFDSNPEEVDLSLMLEDAMEAYRDLANFLLNQDGQWRKRLTKDHGFPADKSGQAAKARFSEFVARLAKEPGLMEALAGCREMLPTRYLEEEWELIRHCFTVLRTAWSELQLVFAQTGLVDFTEVARLALDVLAPHDGFPSEIAMWQAAGTRHLLIDEFQDTSRSQHLLLSRLVAAWPDREGRSCFCVGDPMQSIYGFRDAEVELFERIKTHGLEIAAAGSFLPSEFSEPLRLEFVSLSANFRTTPSLVQDLNAHFEQIFAEDEGSGVRFSAASPARHFEGISEAGTELHLAFALKSATADAASDNPFILSASPEVARERQLNDLVALIREKLVQMKRIQQASQVSSDGQSHSSIRATKFRIAVLGRTKASLIRVANALRKASIGYRAIDLVRLAKRPEVQDALSLGRALLNPADRTAWLAVLRAPWCGLSLKELHRLVSDDDPEVLGTSVPVALDARLPMMLADGQIGPRAHAAASRVAAVLRRAIESRASLAHLAHGSSLGTWLESVWIDLGGLDTVDAEQLANLRLLWAALDKLPGGELDLLGPALNAALDKLCALPDPAASGDFGVQLMTIHKSKGLEFEVVVVTELEAEGSKGERTLVSWLERAPQLAGGDEDDEDLTEFLIAPIQAKGEDAGAAKRWVDREKRNREKQELRRVLYVAATRAREELHLFARPCFSISTKNSNQPELAKPCGLLATAWPAFGGKVRTRFAAWLEEQKISQEHQSQTEFLDLAAQGEVPESGTTSHPANSLVGMPGSVMSDSSPNKPTLLRRLPENYQPRHLMRRAQRQAARSERISLRELPTKLDLHGKEPREDFGLASGAPNTRNAGGLESRLLGTAIHSLLELITRYRQIHTIESELEVLGELTRALPGITAKIRSHGLPLERARKLADEALAVAQSCYSDPIGRWIMAPHGNAGAEARWTGIADDNLRQIRGYRIDRVFFATPPNVANGPTQNSSDERLDEKPVWWIIDYKSSHADGANPSDPKIGDEFLRTHRERHAEQLIMYGKLLRGLQGHDCNPELAEIRVGLYYPRLRVFDSWPI